MVQLAQGEDCARIFWAMCAKLNKKYKILVPSSVFCGFGTGCCY